MFRIVAILLAPALLSLAADEPTRWDTSGNNLLRGDYFFRHVLYQVADRFGNLSSAVALYGTLNFDGDGKYRISGTLAGGGGAPKPLLTTGDYSISAAGMGFMSNPLASGELIYGLAAQGIFAGSSTESGFNDLFIAVPASGLQRSATDFQ